MSAEILFLSCRARVLEFFSRQTPRPINFEQEEKKKINKNNTYQQQRRKSKSKTEPERKKAKQKQQQKKKRSPHHAFSGINCLFFVVRVNQKDKLVLSWRTKWRLIMHKWFFSLRWPVHETKTISTWFECVAADSFFFRWYEELSFREWFL